MWSAFWAIAICGWGVMGLSRATDLAVQPSEEEMQTMERLLKEALDEGFLGLSTMCLKWDKVDGDREWSKSLPSTYAIHCVCRRY